MSRDGKYCFLRLFYPKPILNLCGARFWLCADPVPRVPRILEHGLADTNLGACVWLREEKVSGDTLPQHSRLRPLPAESVLRLGLQMMEALEGAERAQIVHRT